MKLLRDNTCLLVLFIIVSACLIGCGTMRGAGKDIEHTGEAIQRAAD